MVLVCALGCLLAGCESRPLRGELAIALCEATEHGDPGADRLCLWAYRATGDRAIGGRAARERATVGAPRAEIEALAAELGGSPDAWSAIGLAALNESDARAAIAAYHRAVARRDPRDLRGRLDDTCGLILAYRHDGQYGVAARHAAEGYALAQLAPPDDGVELLLGVVTLMVELGNLAVAEGLLAELRRNVGAQPRYESQLHRREGVIARKLRNWSVARTRLQLARTSAWRPDDLDALWNMDMNLIAVAVESGDVAEATRLVAATIVQPGAIANDRITFAYWKASAAILAGRPAEAIEQLRAARADAAPAWHQHLDAVAGQAYLAAGELAEAEAALLRAAAATERSRADLDDDSFKSWLLDDYREPFEDLFLVYVAQRRYVDAFAIVQRATARSVLDGLTRDHLRAPGGTVGQTLGVLPRRLDGLQRVAFAFHQSPAATPAPVEQVLVRLGDHRVWTYFRARDQLWLLATDATRTPRAFSLGRASEVAALVDAWFEAWPRPTELDRLSAQLGERLVPADALPPPGTPLVIATDGPVRTVAFAALVTGGQPLVERNPIAYTPSATVLTHAPPRRAARSIAVLGDPRSDLAAARAEATAVARHLGVSPLLGTSATRAAVIAARDGALLHIASHVVDSPTGPALELGDGLIGSGDVLELRIAPDTVVLLGCASAFGHERDELRSLMTAFVAAGSRVVVATRWSIDDAVAVRFADAFYAAGGARDPVHAVAAAQRRLRAIGVPVTQWAPYVVMGGGASPSSNGGSTP